MDVHEAVEKHDSIRNSLAYLKYSTLTLNRFEVRTLVFTYAYLKMNLAQITTYSDKAISLGEVDRLVSRPPSRKFPFIFIQFHAVMNVHKRCFHVLMFALFAKKNQGLIKTLIDRHNNVHIQSKIKWLKIEVGIAIAGSHRIVIWIPRTTPHVLQRSRIIQFR